jgi:uncharacterized alkaline shock family protein YloU
VTDFPADNGVAAPGPVFASPGDEVRIAAGEPSATQVPARSQAPATAPTPTTSAGPQRLAAVVKGRIDVADEVVEKVAGLAAVDVDGVADLGGDLERALETVRERIGIGQKRGDQGVRARIQGREVAIDVTIVIEYGNVVMDVARKVQANVALQANRMLGLSVVEVNVTVDDVRMPRPPKRERDQPQRSDGLVSIGG